MDIYQAIIAENQVFIDETWEKIVNKLQIVAPKNRYKLPSRTANGIYVDYSKLHPDAWTNGFWPGIMWLLYVGTKDEMFKQAALCAEKLLAAGAEDFDLLYHDVGFMWHISSGVNYRLTGDKKAKSHAMFMAATLAARYNLNTQCIRAFQPKDQERMVIIDTMMNLPLLYWASRETNDPRFSLVAQSHADTAMRNHMRKDGSVYHVLEYDLYTGECLGPIMGQGTAVEGAWTRGQAWAIYGFTLSYIHTGKEEYLQTAKKVAHYFMAAVSETGYIPPYDFRQPAETDFLDTSAGTIAACGLIELAKQVEEQEKAMYLKCAIKMLQALEKKHCVWSLEDEAILQNVAISPKTQNVSGICGEYFLVEAIYKLKGFEPLFW